MWKSIKLVSSDKFLYSVLSYINLILTLGLISKPLSNLLLRLNSSNNLFDLFIPKFLFSSYPSLNLSLSFKNLNSIALELELEPCSTRVLSNFS